MTEPSRIAHGGKTLYGARVGILMLETRFPRIPGDMGNGLTWPFPVLYKVVPGATPDRVVRHKSQGLANAFLDAAAELVQLGADGITTTCGFLSLYQRELAAHVGVPVAASSLMQVPLVERLLPPGKRVGVLTVSAASLTREHLIAAGVDPEIPVVGTDEGREFSRVMLDEKHTLDAAAAEARHPRRRRCAPRAAPRHRRDRARMHQHDALCPRAQRPSAPAGVQHLQLCHLVPGRARAARFRPARQRPARMARAMKRRDRGPLCDRRGLPAAVAADPRAGRL